MKSCIIIALFAALTTLHAAPIHNRGIVDGSLNNAHVLDKIRVLNALVNSSPQELENNNANTRAHGKGNNAAKQYEKRGIIDGSLNNAHALSNINLLNALVNSNPQSLENNNSNSRAQGKGNNSAKQYEKRGIIDGSLNNPHVLSKIGILNAFVNSSPQDGENNNSNGRSKGSKNNAIKQYEKRGIVDGSANNAHVISKVGVANALVNSNPQDLENNNSNTRAHGKGNNSAKQDFDKRDEHQE
ncbi:uncharacterized protein VTP21DRAFT_6702 [Calcarisporiella thermophila]|uniref:uncharacterized protein n=1 Tax=Calcarisporiella thermophila TaxID=911321 RepID=UPI003743CCCC